MEFKFKSSIPYSYMRYGTYQGKFKEIEYYFVPNPEATMNIRDVYYMFSKNENIYDFDEYTAKETINNYCFAGISFRINA